MKHINTPCLQVAAAAWCLELLAERGNVKLQHCDAATALILALARVAEKGQFHLEAQRWGLGAITILARWCIIFLAFSYSDFSALFSEFRPPGFSFLDCPSPLIALCSRQHKMRMAAAGVFELVPVMMSNHASALSDLDLQCRALDCIRELCDGSGPSAGARLLEEGVLSALDKARKQAPGRDRLWREQLDALLDELDWEEAA